MDVVLTVVVFGALIIGMVLLAGGLQMWQLGKFWTMLDRGLRSLNPDDHDKRQD